MEIAYPQGDFIRVAPWGSAGDRKSDGFLKSKRLLFQVYAPNEMKEAKLLKKVREDFYGALPYWGEHFERWAFVHNAFNGLGPGFTKLILELEKNHPKIKLETWSKNELAKIFSDLPRSEKIQLVGYPPPASESELLSRFGLNWLQPLLREFSSASLEESIPLFATLRVIGKELDSSTLSSLRAILSNRLRVQKVCGQHTGNPERVVHDLLEREQKRDILAGPLTRVVQAILDFAVFEPVQPDLSLVSGSSMHVGSHAIVMGLLEREVDWLRADLGAAQQKELSSLQTLFIEGRREEVRQQLDAIQARPNWNNFGNEFRAEVLRLRSTLLLDLDLSESIRLGGLARSLSSESVSLRRLLVLQKLRQGLVEEGLSALADSSDQNDLHLKAEICLVQGKLEVALEILTPLEPTAETHRLLAQVYLHQRLHKQASAEIEKAETAAPTSYSVKYTKAVVQFYTALSAVAMPPQPMSSPTPFPFEFFLDTVEARRQLEQCEQFFRSHTGWGQGELADYRCWRVACLVLLGKSSEALSIYQQDPGHEDLVGWMLAAGYPFDQERARTVLESKLSDGQFRPRVVQSLANLLCQANDSAALASLLDPFRQDFEKWGLQASWITWRCQPYVKAGQYLEALNYCPEDSKEPPLIYLRGILMAAAAAKGDLDPGRALEYLVAQYEQSDDAVYLLEACRLQFRLQNWSWIVDRAEILRDRVATNDVMVMCLNAARQSKNPQLCNELIERSGVDDPFWFLEFRLFASMGLGLWEVALDIASQCWVKRREARTGRHLADIYIRLGNFQALASLARELEVFGELDGEFWLAISQKVMVVDRNQAKRYWHLALRSELESRFVSSAYFLASSLGLGNDPKALTLLSRFQELAAQSQEGNKLVPVDELKDFLAGRRESAIQAERNYFHGASVHFLTGFGSPLPWLYHQLLNNNSQDPNPAGQPPLLIRSAAREKSYPLSAESRLHVDLTAALLAHHFELLGTIQENFPALCLPPSLITALEEAKREIQGRQPELVKAIKDACHLLDRGAFFSDSDLDDANVYTLDFPLNPSPNAPNPVHVHTILKAMQSAGKLSTGDLQRAESQLGNCWGIDTQSGLQKGAVVILNFVWTRLLAESGLLPKVAEWYRLILPDEERSFLKEARAAQERAAELEAWVDELIEQLRSGQPSWIQVAQAEPEHGRNLAIWFELLSFEAQPGDVVWFDDRSASMYSTREDDTPVVGFLDIVDSLRERGKLNSDEYFQLLLNMRRANLRYLPIRPDELSYWFSSESGNLEELVTLRRSIAATLLSCNWLVPPDQHGDLKEWSFLSESHNAMVDAIVDCFRSDGEAKQSFDRADRILQQVFVDLAALRGFADRSGEESSAKMQVYSVARLLLSGLLAFPLRHDQPNRTRLFRWLEARFLRLKSFQPDFQESLALLMIDLLRKLYQTADLTSSIKQGTVQLLPTSLRARIEARQDFMSEIGAKNSRLVQIGELQFDELDFCRAVQAALKGESSLLSSVSGEEWTFRVSGYPVITLSCGQQQLKLEDPFLVLLGEDKQQVSACLAQHPEVFDGPPEVLKQGATLLESIKQPVERYQMFQGLLQDSPSFRYQTLHRQVLETRRSDFGLFEPVSERRLLQRYGLEDWEPDRPFEMALAAAAKRFGPDLAKKIQIC
jgi:hypothetical protein